MQFPGYINQHPWPRRIIPTSYLLPIQWPQPQSEEILLAMEEAEYEEKLNEIRKSNNNIVPMGKVRADTEKEEFDNEADDDDDNGEESEGDEFEQETA
ncbi:hypothetical protein M569_16163 [Genlisea aurea]|uniref:Anaphase-promoting complex subunit 15 n=1 Tax=Genlisea aurea TaxID=192259 RepID=S8DGY4_9LAMI|nr:hypothetical protein M569_16163 [Genlisea aurea]